MRILEGESSAPWSKQPRTSWVKGTRKLGEVVPEEARQVNTKKARGKVKELP